MRPALVVGLTGGIGSGKSTVADMFAALDVPVIDADEIAREVVAPGRPALAEIVREFGDGVQTAGGGLDRGALRELVFPEPARRARLEAILHPRIRGEMQRRLHAVRAPYCILCIPLLLEAGQLDMVDRVLVVDLPREEQIRRTRARDGVARETVEAILDAQADRTRRQQAADDVIDNSGPLEALHEQVESLHRRYLQAAGGHLPASGK